MKFETKAQLKCHMNTFHLNRIEACKRILSQKSCLERHAKEVHPDESHKCFFCQMSFAKKLDLNLHIDDAHLSGHKCKDCKKTFILKSQLETHEKDKHSNFNKCAVCDLSFPTPVQLRIHVNSVHLKSHKL
jgi:hypothetical protein